MLPLGPAQDALYFAWLVAVLGVLVQLPFQVLQLSLQAPMLGEAFSNMNLPPEFRWLEELFTGGGLALFVVGSLAVSLVLYPLSLIINATVTHLGCLLVGASKNGFWATFRVVAYAQVPMIFVGIPFVGVGAWIWAIILTIWGIMQVHQTTGGRAAAGVLAIPVLICCLCCGLWLVAIFGATLL